MGTGSPLRGTGLQSPCSLNMNCRSGGLWGPCLAQPCIPSNAPRRRAGDVLFFVPLCRSLRRAAEISLMVPWLRPRDPDAGGPGSIPGQGTRSHMPRLRPAALKRRNDFFKDRPVVQGSCGVPDICLELSRVYLTYPAHCPPKRLSFLC